MGAQGTSRRACRTLLVGLLGLGLSGCFYMAPPNTAFRSPVVTSSPSSAGSDHVNPDMIYNSRLGLYVVLGYPNHFHDGELYYRKFEGRWQRSATLHEGWAEVRLGEVPRALLAGSPRDPSRTPAPPAKHDY